MGAADGDLRFGFISISQKEWPQKAQKAQNRTLLFASFALFVANPSVI
jgi:hypothetical protein